MIRKLILCLAAAGTMASSIPAQSQGRGEHRPSSESHQAAEEAPSPLLSAGEAWCLTNVRQITFEGERSGEAYYSPDQTMIAFQSVRGSCPHYQIFVKHLDGTSLTRISPGQGLTTCSYFHPSKAEMIWASTHLDPESYGPPPENRSARYQWEKHPSFDIFASDLKGGALRRLTDTPGYDAEGSYSPDGSRICFTSARDGDFEIYTMAADGSDVRRVTQAKGYDGGPFYSPDGAQICFRGFRDPANPRNAQLYVIDADGKNERQLTFDQAVNWAPYFHPNGRFLIYSKNLGSARNFELFIVSLKGGPSVRLTTHDGADVLPVFSPDGKRLLWTSTRVGGRSQIFEADFKIPDDPSFKEM